MQISLILPVYNVEAYLGKCIESCLNQDLPTSEYEIIVVIDGSPDNSIEVARRYQEKNSNIRIVERENGGLSAARNTGLKEAKGEYVWFIDSDDYITENCLGDIVSQMTNLNLDSLWIDWQDVDEYGNVIPQFAPHYYAKNTSVMTGNDMMASVLSNYLFAWSFIFRRLYLIDNNLSFTEGMFYEDTDFAFKSLPIINRIKQYGSVCYCYLQRKNSIVHSISKKKLEDISKNCISATEALRNADNSHKRFYQICFTGFYTAFIKEVLKSRNKEFANYLLQETKKNNFGKVLKFGNIKTKTVGLIYNLFGIKFILRCFFLI